MRELEFHEDSVAVDYDLCPGGYEDNEETVLVLTGAINSHGESVSYTLRVPLVAVFKLPNDFSNKPCLHTLHAVTHSKLDGMFYQRWQSCIRSDRVNPLPTPPGSAKVNYSSCVSFNSC